ncbi:putative heparinase II/III family protein [Magnetofaba australis IT-1]|uniref:Putative heparinase II/III family protein n=1 Tax=Magnetofaba australis IT-1 TaxID=1434232 RepID=A0A1Y2K2Z1_9PROT|nr:putative heparinase II/III family protein [Magnetofaba australis IT-1]
MSLIGPDRMDLLGVARRIDSPDVWNDARIPKLWLYHLHYFEDLIAPDAAARRGEQIALLARWIAENPPGVGNGWEPYPISLRLAHVVAWVLGGAPLSETLHASLSVQARMLAASLEWRVDGNHLLANARGLLFAGALLGGEEGDGWLAQGMALWNQLLAEQILPDGGHNERSAAYHAVILRDLLDLIQLFERVVPHAPVTAPLDMWRQTAAHMLDWLAAMRHGDGLIMQMQDATLHGPPTYDALCDYAHRVGVSTPLASEAAARHFADSGYARLQIGAARLFMDVGAVGPAHQPGHAHAGTLGIELSLGAQRLLVDCGVSEYGESAERLRQRGTAAHNTVCVADADSSEVWRGFRVGARARVFDVSVIKQEGKAMASAWHDGYVRLSGSPRHARYVRLEAGSVIIHDRVIGAYTHAQARFLLHPAVTLEVDDDGVGGRWRWPGGVGRWRIERGAATIEDATWHPDFGCVRPTQRLCVTLAEQESRVWFGWESSQYA